MFHAICKTIDKTLRFATEKTRAGKQALWTLQQQQKQVIQKYAVLEEHISQ